MPVHHSRVLGGALAVALVATTFGIGGGSTIAGAATASTTFTCRGITGDAAGSISGASKSSKELLDLLATLGSSPELTLPVQVDSNIPASVSTGSGGFSSTFTYTISLPDSLMKSAKDLLGVSTIQVKDATFGVNVTGAANTTLSNTTPSIDVSIATTPVVVTQSVTGTIDPSGSGLIYYRPAPARLSIVVNGTVAGMANIGTITVECSASGLLGSTAVRPPGSPIINPNPIVRSAAPGERVTVNLNDGSLVTPDQGNPIVWESVKIAGTPAAGTASVANGVLIFDAPAANGSYDVTFEVCGLPRVVEGAPGVNEIQTINFADKTYVGSNLNTHPMWFTLKFDGQETAPIVTSYVQPIFEWMPPVALNPRDEADRNTHILFGYFVPPTPAQIQAALEALPNVEPGDIVVSGGPARPSDLSNPYTFTFGGALAGADVAQVEVGTWNTWLPNEGLAAILEAAKGIDVGGGDAPVPPTPDESLQQLTNGAIDFGTFWEQIWARAFHDLIAGIDIQGLLDSVTALFPKTPIARTVTTGEVPIADSNTGPLCSQGVLQVVVTGAAVEVQGVSQQSNSAPGAQRAASRVQYAG